MFSMAKAHKQVMGMGMNYANLIDGNFEEEKKEEEPVAFVKSEEVEEDEIEPFEYFDEGDVSYDEEDDEVCCLLTDAEKATIKKWLADKARWKKLRGLGKGFEGGANFVPASPDGNCMFNAISIYTTASKALPNGSDRKHKEVRDKCCDYIVQERHGKMAEFL